MKRKKEDIIPSKIREKQKCLLGETFEVCSYRLRKLILFDLVQKTNQDFCYKCGKKIDTEKELSVEHKIPWMISENPRDVFFDINNIAFSHVNCNKRINAVHGSRAMYQKKCRCEKCVNAEKLYKHNRYLKLKTK